MFFIQVEWLIEFLEWVMLFHLLKELNSNLTKRKQERFKRKLQKINLVLDDFMKQIQQIKKMGDMKDLVGMIPGANKMMKEL